MTSKRSNFCRKMNDSVNHIINNNGHKKNGTNNKGQNKRGNIWASNW